jgi:hypothetical protein
MVCPAPATVARQAQRRPGAAGGTAASSAWLGHNSGGGTTTTLPLAVPPAPASDRGPAARNVTARVAIVVWIAHARPARVSSGKELEATFLRHTSKPGRSIKARMVSAVLIGSQARSRLCPEIPGLNFQLLHSESTPSSTLGRRLRSSILCDKPNSKFIADKDAEDKFIPVTRMTQTLASHGWRLLPTQANELRGSWC